MAVVRTVLTVVYVVICIALIVVVIMQEGKQEGLGALGGSAASTDTYWSKNKGRSMEAGLVKVTRVLAGLFIIISLALNMKW